MRDEREKKVNHSNGLSRTLLYQEVADRLRQDMQAGFHPRGTYLPSEADLCTRFKVSRDTIRRALAVLGEEGLIQSEPGVGHRVRGQVVSAKREKDDLVVAITPYGREAYAFTEMVAGLERSLTDAGLRLVISMLQTHFSGEAQMITAAQVEHVLHMRPQAVVCGLPRNTEASELQRLVRADVPVVVVGDDPKGLAVDYVGTDDRLGAYMISEWLADWAGELPWCVSGAVRFPGLEYRLEGYSLALASRTPKAAEEMVFQLSSTEEDPAVELIEWAQEHRGADRLGVLCTQPDLVLTLASSLEQAGYRLGETAAIGCVSSVWEEAVPNGIPVAAAAWSASEMGNTAAHLALMRGVTGDARQALRVLVAPRPVVAPEYLQSNITTGFGQDEEEGR